MTLLTATAPSTNDQAQALITAGIRHEADGNSTAAISLFRSALALRPCSHETLLHLGNALTAAGEFLEATQVLSKAIALAPREPRAVNTLGIALLRLGLHGRAVVCFRKALALSPRYASAYSNLGLCFLEQGRLPEAIAFLNRAVECNPNLADAYVNLGAAWFSLGRWSEAIASCQRVLALRSRDLEALLNLGNAYKLQGRLERAATVYQEAAKLHPHDPRPLVNLGEARRDQGRMDEAIAAYREALAVSPSMEAYSNLLYTFAFSHQYPASQELAIARRWEHTFLTAPQRSEARCAAHPRAGVFSTSPRSGRKLRLGFVSAELGTHAVAEFLQPFLEHLDRSRFEVVLFPTIGRWCARSDRFRELADGYYTLLGRSDLQAMQLIRDQAIDILVDTSGHTTGNRLGVFAHRAAPVQCTYIGYWSTTGLTEMDWFISDLDAPEVSAHFSEGMWRLPRVNVCYAGDTTLQIAPRAFAPHGTIALGSLNKFSKIREQTIALWATVLRAIPHARLLLEDRAEDETESHQRILSGFAAQGVPASRIEFIPYIPGHERHMLLYNQLDIALDTIPFTSGTTAYDTLWMGVPLVTLDGDWIGGRISGSVLRTLGRTEWIAQNEAEYVRLVRALADDLPARQEVRLHQRAQMAASRLGDAADLTRCLETAFSEMYDRWLDLDSSPSGSDLGSMRSS